MPDQFDPNAYATAQGPGFQPIAPVDPAANPAIQPVPGSETQVSGASYHPAGTPTGGAPAPYPTLAPGAADAQPASPGFPQLTPGAANQPAMVPVTQTNSSTTTQGLDKASAGRVNDATGQANAAATAAGAADAHQQQAVGALDQSQAQAAYGRGVNSYFENAAALHVQDEIIQQTSARLEETARFKPDRTALFHGDNGVLFSVSAAVAAMGGGWLMGQGLTGGKNPGLEAVFHIIDDNARDQIAQNSQVYQELTRRLGSAEAAKRELKARQLQALNDTIDSYTKFERSGLVQQGAATTMARVQAEIAKNNLEAAKLTGKQVSNTVQKQTSMQPNPQAFAGVDIRDPKEYERVGKISALRDFATDAESLAKDGTIANNVGFLDSKWAWIKDAVDARDPAQAKLDTLKAKWELANRASWASEPNGQEVQRRLSEVGFPRNDNEIPVFLANVRAALNAADPGGRYRIAAQAMGNTPKAVESSRTPIVR